MTDRIPVVAVGVGSLTEGPVAAGRCVDRRPPRAAGMATVHLGRSRLCVCLS